ncbi:hypothetical protein, partial [Mycolicibacterium hippocampi]|uniref:hypothetical protein n=1 Tax=Mycolicibacterium hippocampi TaxID=659824 RepID=UPI0021F3B219
MRRYSRVQAVAPQWCRRAHPGAQPAAAGAPRQPDSLLPEGLSRPGADRGAPHAALQSGAGRRTAVVSA